MPATPIDPQKLQKLAEVAVKVGLNLQAGQDQGPAGHLGSGCEQRAHRPCDRATCEHQRRHQVHAASARRGEQDHAREPDQQASSGQGYTPDFSGYYGYSQGVGLLNDKDYIFGRDGQWHIFSGGMTEAKV